jgi:vanillate monooxygenase ferredoxin subunit
VIDVTVTRKTVEASDLCSLELAPIEGALPPFSAGAHIDVQVTPGIVRQYSLIDNLENGDRYLIAALRVP